jgi:D-3-phosphoglycerate dehydrogenase
MSKINRKYKVVITDYDFESLQEIKKALEKVDAELVTAQCKSESEVIELAREADAVINQYYNPLSRKVIEHLKRCKIIVRTGVGVDTIDVQAATDHNICIVNVPDYCLDEVAEHALGLLFMLARKYFVLTNSVKKGQWNWRIVKPIFKMKGQILGIVGLGKIGRSLAKKAKGLGMSLICYDPYINSQMAEEAGVKLLSFENLLKESDFISIHVPLTEETRGMFGEKEFKKMKKGSCIINTSRGPVIERKALYKALKEEWLAGAGLDVMEKEPPDSKESLFSLENVILTPHCAWYSQESVVKLKTIVGEEVARVLSKKRPLSLVNPEVLKKISLN